MASEKKISFGFNKLSKKPTIFRNNRTEEKKVELVECLEGQSIKIKDFVEVVHEPLVIPVRDNNKNLLDRIKETRAKRKAEIKKETDNELDTRPDSELSLEELAAREVINDAKKRLTQSTSDNKVFVLPIKEDKVTLEGEKEPTLDDYDNVPISDYGWAMLRGMGWKEGTGIGRNPKKLATAYTPELRPKGLGLGATKIISAEAPKESVCDKDGNELILKKGVHARIIAGTHKGNYCEVLGLDEEAGRVIVRTTLKGEILTLNEFLITPVTEEEYFERSKVLNNAEYEEYKQSDRLENYDKHSLVDNRTAPTRLLDRKREKYKPSSFSKEKKYSHHESTRNKYSDNKYGKSDSSSGSDYEKVKKDKKKKAKYRRRSRSSSPRDKHKKKSKHRHSSRSSDSDSEEMVKSTKEKKEKHRSRNRKNSSSDDIRSARKNKR